MRFLDFGHTVALLGVENQFEATGPRKCSSKGSSSSDLKKERKKRGAEKGKNKNIF